MIVLSSLENNIVFDRNGTVASARNLLSAHWFLLSLRSGEMKRWRWESGKEVEAGEEISTKDLLLKTLSRLLCTAE